MNSILFLHLLQVRYTFVFRGRLISVDMLPLALKVRRDGSKMTLAQSKKLSQRAADNAQWEDRQLLRSGAVRKTEVQTEFDDEEERKVILLVHGMNL